MSKERRSVVFCNTTHTPYKVEIWTVHQLACEWFWRHLPTLCTGPVWSLNYEDGKFTLYLHDSEKSREFVYRSLHAPAEDAGFPIVYTDVLIDLESMLHEEGIR